MLGKSMIVQCKDKQFYHDPTWTGVYEGRRWMVNFFEEFKLTLESPKKMSQSRSIATAILSEWQVKIGVGKFIEYGAFPPEYERTNSYRFGLTILGMPPVPTECTTKTDCPDFSDLSHCWEVEFPVGQIVEYMSSKPKDRINTYLTNFLLGSELYIGKHNPHRTVKSKLKKQFGTIVGDGYVKVTR